MRECEQFEVVEQLFSGLFVLDVVEEVRDVLFYELKENLLDFCRRYG